MGWVPMSERELRRIEVLSRVVEGRFSVAHAAQVLDLRPSCHIVKHTAVLMLVVTRRELD